MPTLDFKGKQFIYEHHLTVPVRTLQINTEKSLHIRTPPHRPRPHLTDKHRKIT